MGEVSTFAISPMRSMTRFSSHLICKKGEGAARISRGVGELESELRDQLKLMQSFCESFDNGSEVHAKPLATSLRTLLNHQGKNNISLLAQLNLRCGYFKDSVGRIKGDVRCHLGLVSISVKDDVPKWAPRLSQVYRSTLFSDWWTRPVIKPLNGPCFSRKELVLEVADTDGGAHVDPKLKPGYFNLSRANSMGFEFEFEAGKLVNPQGRIELVCVRQIAEEVLHTLVPKRIIL